MKKYTRLFYVLCFMFFFPLSIYIYTYIHKKTPTTSTTQNKIKVAASFYSMYYFASRIGGNKADVINIIPVGVEPHEYELSPKDIVSMEQSTLIVVNGAGLEPWAIKILDDVKKTGAVIVIASEGLADQTIDDKESMQTDPHIWLSPHLAIDEINTITKGFVTVDPQNASYFESNAKQLINDLSKLDAQYHEGLEQCASRDFITSHAAFGYIASHYGLNQIAIQGVSPNDEPSAGAMARISDFTKQHRIQYIFFETLINPKLSQTIASEIGAQTMVLDPIEGVSAEDERAGKDYLSIMKNNLSHLQIALSCN